MRVRWNYQFPSWFGWHSFILSSLEKVQTHATGTLRYGVDWDVESIDGVLAYKSVAILAKSEAMHLHPGFPLFLGDRYSFGHMRFLRPTKSFV